MTTSVKDSMGSIIDIKDMHEFFQYNKVTSDYEVLNGNNADSALYILVRSNCKKITVYRIINTHQTNVLVHRKIGSPNRGGYGISYRPQLIRIKGNILYDVNYRSMVDTPYAQGDVYQHTVQTYLDILWKEKYPVRLYFTSRHSNSGLFRNFSDLNVKFSSADFRNKIIQTLKDSLFKYQYQRRDSLLNIQHNLALSKTELSGLNKWLNSSLTEQRIIQEKELKLREQNALKNNTNAVNNSVAGIEKDGIDSLSKKEDSLATKNAPKDSTNTDSTNKFKNIEDEYAYKKRKADSLEQQITKLDSAYIAVKKSYDKAQSSSIKEIGSINTLGQLNTQMDKMHLSDTILPKGYKSLMAVKSFGLGRCMLDYSELTAKNVSITGGQIEYNPKYYYALAVGYIDYDFRNYLLGSITTPKQYLGIGRIGKGFKEGNNIIFSYFTGNRQLYNSATSSANINTNYSLIGISVEGHYHVNKNNLLTLEIAKSSSPYYSTDSTGSTSKKVFSSFSKLDDRTNQAYAIKLESCIPSTKTLIEGSYRYIGSNFQSFSIFTTGSQQNLWYGKVTQALWHNQLNVIASIRSMGYTNPLISQTFSGTTVFKSIQATLRKKKLPIISVGYFPSAQLIQLSNKSYSENMFYTLSMNAAYVYQFQKIQMNSLLSYTRFYNTSSDSGFVYYNTYTLMYAQTAYIDKLTLSANVSVSINADYHLYVDEFSAQYKLFDWLQVGANAKYNLQTKTNINPQYGYGANMSIQLKSLGSIQIMADKGFIPGSNKKLVANDVGRLTYFKIF